MLRTFPAFPRLRRASTPMHVVPGRWTRFPYTLRRTREVKRLNCAGIAGSTAHHPPEYNGWEIEEQLRHAFRVLGPAAQCKKDTQRAGEGSDVSPRCGPRSTESARQENRAARRGASIEQWPRKNRPDEPRSAIARWASSLVCLVIRHDGRCLRAGPARLVLAYRPSGALGDCALIILGAGRLGARPCIATGPHLCGQPAARPHGCKR